MKRRLLFWLLIVVFLWFVISRLTEIEKLAQTLAQGKWEWVLAAALLQAIYYMVSAALYQAAFYTVGVESRVRNLIPVTLSAVFVNTVTPSGGSAGIALFVNDAARRGQSPARATAGTLLVSVADFCAFTLVLFVGLTYLFLKHDLKIYEVTAAIILLLLTGGQASVLMLGLWQPSLLRRFLTLLQRIVNRLFGWFKRPHPMADDWAARNAADFTAAAAAIGAHPKRLARTLGVALAMHLAGLASLYTLFLAFQQPIKFGVLVAGYAMGFLFLSVSPIPQGIGVVEGTMTLVFTSLGVPGGTAIVIILAFRGISFWLPMVLGFFLLRWVKSFDAERK